MMKNIKSIKGFAMAELLAVCVAMLVIFSILFSNYLPLVAEYENRISYNDVTSNYAAHYLRKMYIGALSDSVNGETRKNTLDKGIEDNNGLFIVYDGSIKEICNQVLSQDKSLCENIIKEYNIEKVAITKYKLQELKDNYKDEISNEKIFSDYVNYLPVYNKYNGRELYRIILKTKHGYATTGIFSEKMGGVKKNLCKFYGPFAEGTRLTEYAYYNDKVYYNLYCTSSNDVLKDALDIKNVKSSNESFLKNIKLISSTNYESTTSGVKGYKYRIEAEAVNYNNEIEDVYLYVDDYKIKDISGIYNEYTKSGNVKIGLLATNMYDKNKPVLTKNSISSTKEKKMEEILNSRIENVGEGTRQAVVEAARFLVIDFPYVIPYYWTDGVKEYPTTGHYARKGLYLSNDPGDGAEDTPWGWDRTKRKLEYGFFKIGENYPNGFECSGYTAWALINGGFEESGSWYTELFNECSSGCDLYYQATYNPETHKYGYSNLFEYYMPKDEADKAYTFWSKLNPTSKKCIRSDCGLEDYNQIDAYDIKAGDLIWKKGHIGMIIGVSESSGKKIYAVAEATYYRNSDGTFSTRGLRVVNYYTDQLYNSSVGWTHIIKMDDIYGAGNTTNYKPWW